MLLALPDVKPDRVVVRFIAAALEVDELAMVPDEVVQLVQVAAEHFGVDQRALDHEIWILQSGRPQGHDPVAREWGLPCLQFLDYAFKGEVEARPAFCHELAGALTVLEVGLQETSVVSLLLVDK